MRKIEFETNFFENKTVKEIQDAIEPLLWFKCVNKFVKDGEFIFESPKMFGTQYNRNPSVNLKINGNKILLSGTNYEKLCKIKDNIL